MSFTDADLSLEELTAPVSMGRVAVIRTSDRIQFKNCRRRWAWSSHLRGNLGGKETYGALWFGSGVHFALEDFHGENLYGHPKLAFQAYVSATAACKDEQALPPDFVDLLPLGDGMMSYYADHWLKSRDPLRTFIWNGVPQVEVNAVVEIDLKLFPRWLRRHYDKVLYSATFDRVVIDDDGLLWLVDYKTAKAIQTSHFQNDQQISAYVWLGSHLYKQPIAGMIYMQFRKTLPDSPRILANGTISTAKNQNTTRSLYRQALVQLYGSDTERWPASNVDTLNHFTKEESPVHDHFVRRDKVERNQSANESTGTKILMEIEDMLDPALPLYPNETRMQCPWCPFLSACTSIDDGSDFQYELDMAFTQRPKARDSWRKYLPAPQPRFQPNLQQNLLLLPT